jgi:hypothetical protein
MSDQDKLTAEELRNLQEHGEREQRAKEALKILTEKNQAKEATARARQYFDDRVAALCKLVKESCLKAAEQGRGQAVIKDFTYQKGNEEHLGQLSGSDKDWIKVWQKMVKEADPAAGLEYTTVEKVIPGGHYAGYYAVPHTPSWVYPGQHPDATQKVFYVYWAPDWAELRDFKWEESYWPPSGYDYDSDWGKWTET